MPDHIESMLRKTAPLIAAAVGVWGASLLADDLPDSVRERALQELRVLDRVPASELHRPAPPRSGTSSVTTTVPSPAKAASPPATRTVIEPAAAASPELSAPVSERPSPHRPAKSSGSDAIETPPTIRPARPTIVRPPIRSRPAVSNPWDELATPTKTFQPTESKPTDEASETKRVVEQILPPSGGQTSVPEASPFAEVVDGPAPSQTEAANPFNVDADAKDWQPATTSPANSIASPLAQEPTRQITAPEPQKTEPLQEKEQKIAALKAADPARRSKPKSEQIGADRPVSVLDFLTQNVGEPVDSTRSIANSQTPASAKASLPRGEFSRRESSPPQSETAAIIEQGQSSVVANGLPRSVRNEESSQHPLESINESDARLSTPPSDHVAANDAPQSEQQKLESRAGRDGFMGFCPVTLRDGKTLVDGQAAFSSSFGEVRYEFASAEAKAAFDGDPERYSPAHAGRDIVLAAGRIDVPGSLRHATYYKNRLYLFRSEQTCRLFESDPARYVADEENGR